MIKIGGTKENLFIKWWQNKWWNLHTLNNGSIYIMSKKLKVDEKREKKMPIMCGSSSEPSHSYLLWHSNHWGHSLHQRSVVSWDDQSHTDVAWSLILLLHAPMTCGLLLYCSIQCFFTPPEFTCRDWSLIFVLFIHPWGKKGKENIYAPLSP